MRMCRHCSAIASSDGLSEPLCGEVVLRLEAG
jgi:hypothetical protein